MPTYAKPVAATAPAYQGSGQQTATAHNRAAFLAAELTLNAVYPMVRLPRGAIVHDVVITVSDMDSATAGLVGIGVAGDVARYIQGASIQAAGSFRMANNATSAATKIAAPYALPAETTIDLVVSTAPGGALAGTVDISVQYTVE